MAESCFLLCPGAKYILRKAGPNVQHREATPAPARKTSHASGLKKSRNSQASGSVSPVGQNARIPHRRKYSGSKRGLCQVFFFLTKCSVERICTYKNPLVRTSPSTQLVPKEACRGAGPSSPGWAEGDGFPSEILLQDGSLHCLSPGPKALGALPLLLPLHGPLQ